MGSAMRDDAGGAERLEESKRRKDEVAPGLDVIMGHSSSSSGAAAAEGAGLTSLQDFPETRPVQSAHGEVMRLDELRCETYEVAEVFCPGRLEVCCRAP